MAFCSRCGTQVHENARYCHQCGNLMETNVTSNPSVQISNAPPPLNTPVQTSPAEGRLQLLFRHKAIYFYIAVAALLCIVGINSGKSFLNVLFLSLSVACFWGALFALFRPNAATLGITVSRWKAALSLFVMFVLFIGLSSAVETPQDKATDAARKQKIQMEEQRKQEEKAAKNASTERLASAKQTEPVKKAPEKPRNEASLNYDGVEYRAYVSSNVIISILSINSTKNISNGYSNTQASGIFKVVKIGAVNNQKDAITLDSNSFKLIDNQGREFSVSSEASTAIMMRGDEGFFLKQINPGIGVSGLVAFEVPNDTQIIKMRARGGMTGKTIDIPFRIDKI